MKLLLLVQTKQDLDHIVHHQALLGLWNHLTHSWQLFFHIKILTKVKKATYKKHLLFIIICKNTLNKKVYYILSMADILVLIVFTEVIKIFFLKLFWYNYFFYFKGRLFYGQNFTHCLKILYVFTKDRFYSWILDNKKGVYQVRNLIFFQIYYISNLKFYSSLFLNYYKSGIKGSLSV